MSLHELHSFAKAYAGLGTSVQEQLDHIIETSGRIDPDHLNPEALRLIQRELGDNSDLAELLEVAAARLDDADDADDAVCPDDPDGQHHIGCGCENKPVP